MANDNPISRRKLLVAAGAAGLGVLAANVPEARASKYPKLDVALEQMRVARKELQDAGRVFGGHRAKAVEALNRAIEELDAAIKFASR
jgi:hypothetical protein